MYRCDHEELREFRAFEVSRHERGENQNGESKHRTPLTNAEFHTKLDKAYDSVVQDSGTEVGMQWLQVSGDLSALSCRSV